VANRDQKRKKDVAGAHGPLNDEGKSLSHVKDDPPVKHDRSPREPNIFMSLEILGGHNHSIRYCLFAIIKTEYHQWLLLSLFQMA
jgi:hypothetical protein